MITNRTPFAAALLASLGLALVMLQPASARTSNLNVKTGLWEMTTVAKTSGTPPVDLSNVPPEKRAQMQAMMDKLMKSAAMPHTIHTCVTPEKLAQSPFQDFNKESCTHTVVAATATMMDVKFQCKQQRETTSGEWRFEATSPVTVKGNGQMTIERAGRKMESTSTITGKWVGSSCGSVK